VDWSKLFAVRPPAVVTKTAGQKAAASLDGAPTAQAAGWSWQIPLQKSHGAGLCVLEQIFAAMAAAKSTLMRSLGGSALEDPRVIPFTTGPPQRTVETQLSVDRPCLRLCRAAGGDIHPHDCPWDGFFFLRYFSGFKTAIPRLIREYNRRMVADYEENPRFHRSALQRPPPGTTRLSGNGARTSSCPTHCRKRIELFKAPRWRCAKGSMKLFRGSSWQSVFEGMGISPSVYSRPRGRVWTTRKIAALIEYRQGPPLPAWWLTLADPRRILAERRSASDSENLSSLDCFCGAALAYDVASSQTDAHLWMSTPSNRRQVVQGLVAAALPVSVLSLWKGIEWQWPGRAPWWWAGYRLPAISRFPVACVLEGPQQCRPPCWPTALRIFSTASTAAGPEGQGIP